MTKTRSPRAPWRPRNAPKHVDTWKRYLEYEFPQMPTLLPPGEKGVARIAHITATSEDVQLHNLRAGFRPGGRYNRMEPGTYAQLFVRNQLVMSDTLMERQTNMRVVQRATGRVLIAGLGLGMILHPILAKPDVTHVTVLEKEQDVIDLVGPSLAGYGDRLTIIHADAFTWRAPKGETWDGIYFDIWPEIVGENVDEHNKLARRWSARLNRANPKARMAGWRIEELRTLRDRWRA